jgi:hypothetical protein
MRTKERSLYTEEQIPVNTLLPTEENTSLEFARLWLRNPDQFTLLCKINNTKRESIPPLTSSRNSARKGPKAKLIYLLS